MIVRPRWVTTGAHRTRLTCISLRTGPRGRYAFFTRERRRCSGRSAPGASGLPASDGAERAKRARRVRGHEASHLVR